MEKPPKRISYWRKLIKGLHRRRIFRWAKTWLLMLLLMAVFGDFIANDIPLFCRYKGAARFPILEQVLGGGTIFNQTTDWNNPQITSKIYPPIPYRFNSIDPLNSQFKSPFGKQNIKSLKYRHWLGTDQIGRDVLAGMINGARVSVEVGFLGIGLAAIIGILLGSFSGFFGNYRIKWSIGQWVITIVSLLALAWLAYVLPFYWPQNGGGIIFGLVLLFIFLQVGLSRINFKTKKIPVPVDGATIRLVEVFNAIPNLLLVLVISVLFPPSLLVVALVIGVTHWPMITLFVRGEMLKIRQREYLLAAKMQNIPEWKILWRHALPNAIGPALIVIMLGLGSAILAEAFLSFIGLGLPPDLVSWGKLLAASRENFSAWWMAVFPGLAIFLTIFSANRIGEILLEEMKAA